jgi:hypothetical protein
MSMSLAKQRSPERIVPAAGKRRGALVGALAALGFLVQGCGAAVEEGEAGESLREPIIFGADDRVEYGGISDPRFLHYAQATAALFYEDDVVCSGGDCDLATIPFETSPRTGSQFDPLPLCTNAPDYGQEQGASCTAFLVGPDLFATAGHCFCRDTNPSLCPFGLRPDELGCAGMRVVFGFHADANGQNEVLVVPETEVYSCTEITGVYEVTPTDEDWAFFRVDRVVSDRTALIAGYSGTPSPTGELLIAGHPDGLPLKVAGGGEARGDPSSDPVNWTTSLDAFGGNSGSPVINLLSGVVEGIHVRRPYHHYISTGGCGMPRVCSETTGCNPNFVGIPWAQATNMGWAAAQGELPLHAALITAL